MSWWIDEHIAINDDETKQLCSISVDTAADLPEQDQTATAGFIFVRGSSARDVETGRKYIMNSAGQWIQQPSGALELEAEKIDYNNTESGLSADNVQSALDEISLKSSHKMYVGACATAANIAAKQIVCDPSFELKNGVIIAVKFTYSNTAANVTFSVNGSEAKQIYVNNAVYTSTSNAYLGYAKRYNFYVYNGENWVYIAKSVTETTYSSMSQTEASAGTATTARTISAKVLHDTIENRLELPEQKINEIIDTGAKNRLRNLAAPGTTTIRGVPFTVNTDGTITIGTGTVTGGNADLTINANVTGLKNGTTYILSGCPADGSTSTYRLNISGIGADTGTGLEFLYDATAINVYIRISTGTVISSPLVFRPMIRAAGTDDIYAPYAPTNRELYEMIIAMGG